MDFSQREADRFHEALFVLYKLSNEENIELIRDAVHDLIFGYGINHIDYITEEEFKESMNDVLELINGRWECE